MSRRVLPLAAVLLVAVPPVTFAQQIGAPPGPFFGFGRTAPPPLDAGYAAPPGVVYAGRSAYGTPIFCLKRCEGDTNPCDPIEYKRADMRCTEGAGF